MGFSYGYLDLQPWEITLGNFVTVPPTEVQVGDYVIVSEMRSKYAPRALPVVEKVGRSRLLLAFNVLADQETEYVHRVYVQKTTVTKVWRAQQEAVP